MHSLGPWYAKSTASIGIDAAIPLAADGPPERAPSILSRRPPWFAKGVLFLVDARDGKVRASHVFGPDGDYEGLARVAGDYWVLRSDGRLARVAPSEGGYAIAETFDLGLPNRDLEGLCFDPTTGWLLVAPKEVLKGEKPKGKRDDPEREKAKVPA